jgi:predicted metal-dependent peptidase
MAEAINYDAEKLYEKLLQEKQQRQHQQNGQDNGQSRGNQQQSQQQGESGNGSSQERDKESQEQSGGGSGDDSQGEKQQDVGHDTHSMWEQAVKKHKEEQEKSGKKESLLDKLLGEDKKEKEKTELEKKQEELEGMGEKDAFKKNLEDKKKQLEELKEAITKQASLAGTSTNRDVRTVNDIGTAKPIVDWRYVLREAAKYDVDWSYRNAIIDNGVVVANLEEQPISETEIVLDTSGSVDETLLKNFLRECKNILQHTKLKVGCFDTKFYGFYEIETEEDIENMQFKGGGGTDFNVALNAFSRRVENKIIFTDGNAPMPDMPLDAIWIVFGGEKINPKGGRVIHITPEKLNRLYSCEIEYETKGRLR